MKKFFILMFLVLGLYAQEKIIMLGDSITRGGEWQKLLNYNNIENHGINGDTTKDILNRVEKIAPDTKKVFIMAGINDFAKGYSAGSTFIIYKEIVEMLRKKDIKVYIQSTLYAGSRMAPVFNNKVKELNSLLKDFAKKNRIKFIDLNRHLSKNGVLTRKYTRDEVHLNAIGYYIWSNVIKAYIK